MKYLRLFQTEAEYTAYKDSEDFVTPNVSYTIDSIKTFYNPVTCSTSNYVMVDLGLPSGLKWADRNVGADSPEDAGLYFAWGETTTKSTYSWSTYTYCKGSSTTLTKYNCSSGYGTLDNKTTLELSDDVAAINWGGAWRMPTDAEITELREQCTWTWITYNGVNGYKVTSKSNGNSIFLPAAGLRFYGDPLSDDGSHGYYWSSTSYSSTSRARDLYFASSYVNSASYYNRSYGFSVRCLLSGR